MPKSTADKSGFGALGALENIQSALDTIMESLPCPGDFLLYLVSNKGRIMDKDAKDAWIQAFPEHQHSFEACRRVLFELGHIDYEYKNGLYLIARRQSLELTTITPLCDRYEAILCGARSEDQLKGLSESLNEQLTIEDGQVDVAPRRVRLLATLDKLNEIATQKKLAFNPAYPAAWRWIHYSASLSEWWSKWLGMSANALAPVENGFNLRTFRFDAELSAETKLFLTRKSQWIGYPSYNLYYKTQGQDGWRLMAACEPDWAKWVVLAIEGKDQTWVYDKNKQCIRCPRYCPLPGLIGRAIAMCSGYAPDLIMVHGVEYLEYRKVPPVFECLLKEKLNLSL